MKMWSKFGWLKFRKYLFYLVSKYFRVFVYEIKVTNIFCLYNLHTFLWFDDSGKFLSFPLELIDNYSTKLGKGIIEWIVWLFILPNIYNETFFSISLHCLSFCLLLRFFRVCHHIWSREEIPKDIEFVFDCNSEDYDCHHRNAPLGHFCHLHCFECFCCLLLLFVHLADVLLLSSSREWTSISHTYC